MTASIMSLAVWVQGPPGAECSAVWNNVPQETIGHEASHQPIRAQTGLSLVVSFPPAEGHVTKGEGEFVGVGLRCFVLLHTISFWS